MAKEANLYKEVSDVFGGYHPLALFEKGVLYINEDTIKDLAFDRVRLLDLIDNGPECWGLKDIVLGNKPERVELEYMGSRNPS